MKRIVLLRHGESVWNKENRFTGWTDVDLTENGVEEAKRAGRMMSEAGLSFGMAFTSYLKRAVKTLNYALDMMNLDWIPVEKSWQLNEKHYGILQGLNKKETARKYGSEQVFLWRRSYDVAPDPVLVAAHGNSLRAIVKILKGISDEDIVNLNLPTGIPYVFEFDDALRLRRDYFLGDEEEIRRMMEQVAGQAG